jgi:hypothetical protein
MTRLFRANRRSIASFIGQSRKGSAQQREDFRRILKRRTRSEPGTSKRRVFKFHFSATARRGFALSNQEKEEPCGH